jgi:hypothetical protein
VLDIIFGIVQANLMVLQESVNLKPGLESKKPT